MNPRKVVMVGSTTFPLDAQVGSEIADIMARYGSDVVFMTRAAKEGFDLFVTRVADILDAPCLRFIGHGHDNFERDVEMVSNCDEVIAFLDPDSLADMNTGTAHVIEVALSARKPVKAYSAANGHLVFAGES